MFSDRAAAAWRSRCLSDPSRSTDLDVLGRLLTTISDDLIIDSLTLIERTKAGTFDSRDMDEHVSAAVLGLNHIARPGTRFWSAAIVHEQIVGAPGAD